MDRCMPVIGGVVQVGGEEGGIGGGAKTLLASTPAKTSVHTFMHTQAFLLRPPKCE